MTPGIDPTGLTVVVATRLEANAAQRELPRGVQVVRAGIRLARGPQRFDGRVISCGLAGSVARGLPTGTVLVPCAVDAPDGTRRRCDPAMTEALMDAARRVGCEPQTAPLYTSATIARGAERERLAAEGYAGVDMESALINAPLLAAVRVILDTPEHELSDAWLSPLHALLTPLAWRELPWLVRTAPRCAHLAARVVAAALRTT